MNIVFMGTPDFAVSPLRALLEAGYSIKGVVTQPDRPKGRKQILTPPPVKAEAEKHGLRILQPQKLRDPESVAELASLQPDLIVTAAYGQLLPKAVLDMPKYGCINIHASLLPRYRGGAPIHYAVMNGEAVTGVTIMYMAEGLDTGDMISRVEVPILDSDTTGTMHDKLSEAGAQLLIQTLPGMLDGSIRAIPQNHEQATYARNITRADEKIDWSRSSLEIYNQVRGLCPWPGAYTIWNGEVMKVWACRNPKLDERESDVQIPAASRGLQTAPGTVLEMNEKGIRVATGSGSVRLTEIQPAGKKKMTVGEFARGTIISGGTVFGDGTGE
ncbi:methionyl-tRNA formyltransferase [Ferviditalea candida]|uniref:Methionyl-tRNA formyltransferase n=1 Tax=Ferviditalea candida TaxID=3108399 RepID=A0ABU5ZFF4_9BACL|nr:methionyl-tRNA formyltransferase [Paenibacillaceae bacterium T2]